MRLLSIFVLTAQFLFNTRGADNWFNFAPTDDSFAESPIDLRFLNDKIAGERGVIAAKGDQFVYAQTGKPVRFWAVNGPPHELTGEALKKSARRLAKYGVNMCRMHTAVFEKAGEADPKKIAHAQEAVDALKAEGIYSHFSIYFPLWLQPQPDNAFLKGYDGKTHPFAALMFNPEFQQKYRDWWKALLTTPNPGTGRTLAGDPAVFGLEIQNEDSFFFWTFDAKRIPDAQLRILERQFGDWLTSKHGSIQAALARWDGVKVDRDQPAEGRVGFRPLWNMFSEKKARDQETAAFLFELQRKFYQETYDYLRSLGFKGLITASNWSTASPEIFGPLEKWSYAATDFIDRHGYFSVDHKGDNSAWSIRNGHTYADRSALRFEPSTPGKPKQFVHPAMDPTYAGKPSMISETTWNRPNRFRSEAPLYFACYGALQGTDAIVHFAHDGDRWAVKPNFWMQPWTLMAPSQMAQFPAAALLYRKALVRVGDVLAKVNLNTNDLLSLKGTPLPQDASLDELRLKDVPARGEIKAGQRIDPLIHYAGRVEVQFGGGPTRANVDDLGALIDHNQQQARSSTRELSLNYKEGILTINAPQAQGLSGNIRGAKISLNDVSITSTLDNVHIIVVSLDGQKLSDAKRMLLQVMSEERPTGFRAEESANGILKIAEIGRDPWQVKSIEGKVTFKNAVQIQPLDFNGYPVGQNKKGAEITLAPDTIYYLLTR